MWRTFSFRDIVYYYLQPIKFSKQYDRLSHQQLGFLSWIAFRRICVLAETRCENGIIYNSTCYKIHRENVTWFTAVNRCLSNNGNLAVFDDDILTYFASTLLTDGRLWIGLVKSWWTWPDAGLYSWQWHQQNTDVRCVYVITHYHKFDLAVIEGISLLKSKSAIGSY